jgi:2-iminobutanoate/2-iminopropanoate deaminase
MKGHTESPHAHPERSWQPVATGTIPPPAGAYSRAVKAGPFIFISGQVPRDMESGELLGEDVATQTRAVLENVRRLLEAAGATLEDVVSVTAYLADAVDWTTFNEVYQETFQPPYPTRTTVGAELRGIRVEISAVAFVQG